MRTKTCFDRTITLRRKEDWKDTSRWIRLVLFLSILLGIVHCTQPQTKLTVPPQALVTRSFWPHEASDLTPDPDTLLGRLPNGFGYALKVNTTPRDRVAMYLVLQSGSLNESDSEKGLAHFLEHMVFNGSQNFPPGEMVKFFQRIGMQFGPDANAHTGFSQTVYDVILPKGDSKSLSEGMTVLKDYAEGALLLEEEVQRERKVILAEMRSRDSAEYRMIKSVLDFEMPRTLVPRRFPIGEEEVLEKIDASQMRDYYDTWYRPERMTLVMVGEFDKAEALEQITARFGSIHPRAAERSLPAFGAFSHHGEKAFHRFEPDMGSTKVSIETVVMEPAPQDSIEWQRENFLGDLADQILQNRLKKLLQRSESELSEINVASGYYLQQVKFSEISADTQPAQWRRVLGTLEQELRRALVYGFTPAEVDRVKKEKEAELRRDVEESKSLESNAIAGRIIANLNSRRVWQSPRQRLDLLQPILYGTTATQLHDVFRRGWSAPHRLILVTGNVDLSREDKPATEAILAAYRHSAEVVVKSLKNESGGKFPYLSQPQRKGTIVGHRNMPMGIEYIVFDNGVHLLLKPTRFKDKEVIINLTFGGGEAFQPLDRPGLAQMTEEVINNSGFASIDRSELEESLAGRVASIALDVREEMCVIKGEAISSEMGLLFELLYTQIKDPGYRKEARELALKRYDQRQLSMMAEVEGVMQMQGQRLLAGGDSRFGLPSWDEFKSRTLEEVQTWFGEQLQHGPLEIAVVGDFDTQHAIDLAARYFGALPPRSAAANWKATPTPNFPRGARHTLTAQSAIPKALLVVAYPTDDFWDIGRTRRLNILADILTEKMRERIRERLGAVYSPFAFNRSHRAYPCFGILQVRLSIDPSQAEMLIGEVNAIAAETARGGIEADQFHRILDPTLVGIKDLRQTNNYWLNSVLTGASRHPEQLVWSQTMEQDYAAISAAEISALARHYLVFDTSAVVVVRPR